MYTLKPISHIRKIKSAWEFHIFSQLKNEKKKQQHKFKHLLLTVEKEGSPILLMYASTTEGHVCLKVMKDRK